MISINADVSIDILFEFRLYNALKLVSRLDLDMIASSLDTVLLKPVIFRC